MVIPAVLDPALATAVGCVVSPAGYLQNSEREKPHSGETNQSCRVRAHASLRTGVRVCRTVPVPDAVELPASHSMRTCRHPRHGMD